MATKSVFYWTSSFELSIQLSKHLQSAGGVRLIEGRHDGNHRPVPQSPTIFIYETPDILLFPDALIDCEVTNTPYSELETVYRRARSEDYRHYSHVQATRLMRMEPDMLRYNMANLSDLETSLTQPRFRLYSSSPLRAAGTLLYLLQHPNELSLVQRYEQELNVKSSMSVDTVSYLEKLQSLTCHDQIYHGLLHETSLGFPIGLSARAQIVSPEGADSWLHSQVLTLQHQLRHLQSVLIRMDERESSLIRYSQITEDKLTWNRKRVDYYHSLATGYRGIAERMIGILSILL